jgi:hypothetical protein
LPNGDSITLDVRSADSLSPTFSMDGASFPPRPTERWLLRREDTPLERYAAIIG